jgi:signal transduction histidine kinase
MINRYAKFWPLWFASVLVPLCVLVAAAWWSWNLERIEAQNRLVRTVDLLCEHALRTFETQDALLIAAQGYTAPISWEEIAKSRAVADFLRVLNAGTPGVSAIGIAAPDGRLLHDSRAPFPLPRAVELSDQYHAAAQYASSAGTYVGETFVDDADGRVVFAYSRPHHGMDGKPDGGLIWASLLPGGFTNFYATVVETPGDTVALLRDDGALLARYPPLSQPTASRLPLDSAPMRAARAATGATAGATAFVEDESPVDIAPRLYAARRLGNLPVSIIYGLHADGLRLDWLREVRVIVTATAAAMAFLLVLTWLVTHRSLREEVALERARVDAELRAEAEAALRRGQRLEILGQIAAGVAHDFRNVVHAVRGGMDIVRRALDDGDVTRAKDVVDMVAGAAERGDRLTKRMLQMVTKPRGDDEQPTETGMEFSDPVAVAELTSELLKRTIGNNCTVRLQVDPSGLPRRVRGEPAELEAALLNLALNARDAMPSGGEVLIYLSVEDVVASEPPDPEGLSSGRYIRITVSDAGIGMDSATLARAAEPFFTTKSAERGTGLGLSTVRDFARGAGGALRVESPGPGRGTAVTLWLPQCS